MDAMLSLVAFGDDALSVLPAVGVMLLFAAGLIAIGASRWRVGPG
jgi:hypothetical protein